MNRSYKAELHLDFSVRFQFEALEGIRLMIDLYLTKEEILKLAGYRAKSKVDTLVRDMFLFSCFTGLAYTDIKHLTKKQLQKQEDGNLWIILRRRKTNTLSMIRLLDIPLAILKRYSVRRKYILPIPSDNCCNEHLSDIGKKCGINVHLTFHVARHTFATLSRNQFTGWRRR